MTSSTGWMVLFSQSHSTSLQHHSFRLHQKDKTKIGGLPPGGLGRSLTFTNYDLSCEQQEAIFCLSVEADGALGDTSRHSWECVRRPRPERLVSLCPRRQQCPRDKDRYIRISSTTTLWTYSLSPNIRICSCAVRTLLWYSPRNQDWKEFGFWAFCQITASFWNLHSFTFKLFGWICKTKLKAILCMTVP